MMLYLLIKPALNENVELFSLFIGNVLVKYGREWFALHKKDCIVLKMKSKRSRVRG